MYVLGLVTFVLGLVMFRIMFSYDCVYCFGFSYDCVYCFGFSYLVLN